MNRYKKLFKNIGFTAIGTFGSKLLVFFFVRFYTEYLTTDEYGTADLITQTAKLLMPIIAAGITDAVFRFSLDNDQNPNSAFSVGFYTLCIGSLFLAPIGYILSLTGYFDNYVYLIVLYVIASNFHSLSTQYIRTKNHYKFYGIQGVINTSLVIILNILFLAILHIGIDGYVLSVILADFLTTLIVVVKEKLWLDIVSPKIIEKQLVKKMMKYSIPLIPTTVIWWITSVSDRYIVKGFCGGDVNGIYTAAYKIPTLLVLLCTVFIQAWNFSSVAENDEKDRSIFFSTVFSSFSSLMFVAGSLISLFCELIKYILFEKTYFSATDYIPILTIATVFSCLVSFIGSIYTVKKRSVLSMTTALAGALLNIIMNFILVPDEMFGIKLAGLGASGAAIATFFSYFTVFIIRAMTVKSVLPFDMKIKRLILNSLILCVQVIIATMRPFSGTSLLGIPVYIIIQIPFAVIITVISIKPLLLSLTALIKK